ncbi:unnamed protein product [Schistocephalus solidus]|uniref:COP9 signalosome complex subunit 3 n=1 Tax=Schistocephalus solidus TaxID=70667 RepID=A0A183SSJ4_SCHSO|nr:unnamed protein product [Schistocephalus solidus]
MIPISTQRSILDEAAKKHLLVSLIHQGKYPPDGVYLESIHSLMPTRQGTFDKYRALSNAFSSPDPATLARVIDNEAETFRATFMTLSLSDLAARVHLSDAAEAEHHLLEMIPSKSIHVRINQEDETVRFLDDAERYDSAEMLKVLSQKMEKAMNLEKKMMQMSDQLALVLAASKKSQDDDRRWESAQVAGAAGAATGRIKKTGDERGRRWLARPEPPLGVPYTWLGSHGVGVP